MIVSGKISVKAILKERKRDIQTVYILDKHNDRESRYVLGISQGLPVERLDREAMNELAGNTSHGGYLVECGPRNTDRIETLTQGAVALMCIEGVTDPFNLGEICRTVASLGFDGIITPNYNFYDNEAKLIRASAGASESLWWLKSDKLDEDLMSIKQQSVKIVAAYRGEKSVALHHYEMPERVCIALGGALRGLSRSILDLSDDHVRIDYDARVSLSTVGAATSFAYEHYRQKGGHE